MYHFMDYQRYSLFLVLLTLSNDISPIQSQFATIARTGNASLNDPWEDAVINSKASLFSKSAFLNSSILNVANKSLELLANNPETRPEEWIAIGDSFAAGPGAGALYGQDVGCKRGQNAYPPQMQNDPSMPGPDPPPLPSKPKFDFRACTGDVTQDFTDQDNPNYQLGTISESTSFLTLPIGGNDIGFSTILRRCIYGLGTKIGTCVDFIENARKKLYSTEFYDSYNKVLNTALEKLNFERRYRGNKRTILYQTGYPQFFDSYPSQCDRVTFMIGFLGPKLVKQLRRDLNRVTHEVNYVLQYWMDNLNAHHTVQSGWPVRFFTAFDWADQDLVYTDHRFCREGVVEPDRPNPDTWFFRLQPPLIADDTKNGSNTKGLDNNNAKVVKKFDEEFTWEGVKATVAPMWMTKTFHPKSAGFRETKNLLMFKLHYRDALRALVGISADIMVVGDIVAAGSNNPQSERYQGFRGHLHSLLRDPRLFLWGRIEHTFIGSQSTEYLGYLEHECYPRANLEELYDHLHE